MKIAVVSPEPVPPVFGGMTRLLEGLCGALRERHPTDLITIPFDERTREGVLRGYYDFYHLDLSAYDRVISYKAPSFMLRHPNQVHYLSHRLRVFYDLYEQGDTDHARLRDLIHFMDNWALDKQRIPYLFTVGETVCRRLRKFGNIDSTALHHPTTFQPGEPRPGEYFLSVGRLHPWKRADLIIRAFRRTQIDAPLKIVGEGPQEQELRELAAGDARIEFLGKLLDHELADAYSRALVTIFPPISEDMGLITFESFLSGKPVLATDDSGEPALIIEEGRTGFVTAATPESMAERMEWIWSHRSEVDAMGTACREWMRRVTWNRVVDTLLDAGDRIEARSREMRSEPTPPHEGNGHALSRAAERRQIRLLVTDNQIIDPPIGGGRIRIYELYRHIPEDFMTTYVGAFDYPGPTFRDQLFAPNFREILTPLTGAHFKSHNIFARLTRGDATVDVTMPLLGRMTPRYRRLIEKYLPEADILICAHPWMFPFLPPTDLPRIYDSQNCEALVKGPLLSRTLTGRWLARGVKSTERLAIKQSRLVLACSDEDSEAFTDLYGVAPEKIFDVPNGVDCRIIRPANEQEKIESRSRLGIARDNFVVFTGSNYAPNLEGAEFIIFNLAPQFPGIQFGLVGGVGVMFKERHPDHQLPENIKLFGFVEFAQLLDIYHAADLALNPMLHGSGTNIKMLDYMAAGLPILTSPKGARGLKGIDGEHWIEASVENFAIELKGLIESDETTNRLGAAGRSLAESRYDWTQIAAKLAGRLRTLVGINV